MSTLNSAPALECGHWHHHSVTGCVVLSLEPLGSAVGLAPPRSCTHWDWWLQAHSMRGRHPVPDGTRPYSLSINTGYAGQNKALNAASLAALIIAGRASRAAHLLPLGTAVQVLHS